MPTVPPVHYVSTPHGDIAYRTFGRGEIDVVWLQGLGRTVEVIDEYPPMAEMLQRMGRYMRLVIFDRRGTGRTGPKTSRAFLTGSASAAPR
jgi:pimeloyl-ACP methyl ester carboxylesterase